MLFRSIQGGIGACIALAVLATGFFSVRRVWADALTSLLDGGTLQFLSPVLCVALLVGGMCVGAAGGFAASRHAR